MCVRVLVRVLVGCVRACARGGVEWGWMDPLASVRVLVVGRGWVGGGGE